MLKIIKSQLDGLLWDMDGVLIDVSKSYMEAIRLTAQEFLKRKITKEEVTEKKSVIGMNNEFDATYAIISGIHHYKKITRHGRLYAKIVQIFQSYYLGSSLYEEYYGKKPPIKQSKGLIETEKLLVTKTDLKNLQKKYIRMAIVTGRNKYETEIALETHGIYDYFEKIIVEEDTKMHKPHPEPLLKAKSELNFKNTVYIGDSPSDTEAARQAYIPCIYIGTHDLGDLKFSTSKEAVSYLLLRGKTTSLRT